MRRAGSSLVVALGSAFAACASLNCSSQQEIDAVEDLVAIEPRRDLALAREPLFAKLGEGLSEADGFERLRAAFAARNPGYDLRWMPAARAIAPRASCAIAFVQAGESAGAIGARRSELRRGDVALLRAGEELALESALDVLVFDVPEDLPRALPSFVRPDHDPRITDTPGGCAEELEAYRRILLTWRSEVGPYVFRALNAHRVRIFDSFTHYHPPHGGFDELYLVQGVQPGAKLITSSRTARIVEPDTLAESELDSLLVEHELEVGDLVYLPRGTIHRGVGGVLTQVITVPGFRPGAEIGVDHFLAGLNRRFPQRAPLPLHAKGADAPMVK
ncbi:MAG: hypothetical protein IPN34_02830 [Planctomycetes bacterium]|nr:hypothetical protein [Planctomycetota bacterium]